MSSWSHGIQLIDIFLSYAKLDLERVRPLVERLEEHGWSVWWDREIPPGQTWPQLIENGLAVTKAMIVVWSEVSVKSKWVVIEATKGEERGAFIPIKIDPVEVPLQFSLIHAADLTARDYGADNQQLQKVMQELEKILGAPTPIAEPVVEQKEMPAEHPVDVHEGVEPTSPISKSATEARCKQRAATEAEAKHQTEEERKRSEKERIEREKAAEEQTAKEREVRQNLEAEVKRNTKQEAQRKAEVEQQRYEAQRKIKEKTPLSEEVHNQAGQANAAESSATNVETEGSHQAPTKFIVLGGLIFIIILVVGLRENFIDRVPNSELTSSVDKPTPTSYANDCNGHLKFAVLDKMENVDRVLCKEGYAVGYSFFYKAPLWVSYKLTEASVTPDNGRGGNPFAEDETLPIEARSTMLDYKYSGWDRGHMAPRAAMDSTPALRDESFLMSNMTPQHPRLNQGGWKELERYVRELAIEFDEIYVVTGALFKGVTRTIGKGVHIPSAVFKAIYIPSIQQVLAFVVPNEPFDIDDLEYVQETINFVENRSGLQLFNEIPNSIETLIEKEEINYCTELTQGSLASASCP